MTRLHRKSEPDPGAGIPLICGCGSGLAWFSCQAGSAPESRELERGVYVLRPAVEVPAIVWCLKCWPWTPPKRKAKPHAKRSRLR